MAASRPTSSARRGSTVTRVHSQRAAAWTRNPALRRSDSIRVTRRSGRMMAITSPGTPPPAPMSVTRARWPGWRGRQAACLGEVAALRLLPRDGGQVDPLIPPVQLIEVPRQPLLHLDAGHGRRAHRRRPSRPCPRLPRLRRACHHVSTRQDDLRGADGHAQPVPRCSAPRLTIIYYDGDGNVIGAGSSAPTAARQAEELVPPAAATSRSAPQAQGV